MKRNNKHFTNKFAKIQTMKLVILEKIKYKT